MCLQVLQHQLQLKKDWNKSDPKLSLPLFNKGYFIKTKDIVTISTILIALVSDSEEKKIDEILSQFILTLLEQELALGHRVNDLFRLLDFMNRIITSAIVSNKLTSIEISELFDYIREKNELSEKRVRQLVG